MENQREESIKYVALGQSDDPFGNEGAIGDLLVGRFCNPQEPISPYSAGILRFPPYPGQFGSQDSNKSSLLDPDLDRVQTAKPNSRKRKLIPSASGGNGKDSPASSSLTASNSKVSQSLSQYNKVFSFLYGFIREYEMLILGRVCDQVSGEIVGTKRSKQDEAGSSNKDDAKPPEPPKDYIHVRARRGQATDSHSLAERVLTTPTGLFVCPCFCSTLHF